MQWIHVIPGSCVHSLFIVDEDEDDADTEEGKIVERVAIAGFYIRNEFIIEKKEVEKYYNMKILFW